MKLSTAARAGDSLEVFRASFDRFARVKDTVDVPWLAALRTAAMARFAERGFPTTRDEAWRHTNVAPLVHTTFHPPEPDLSVDDTAPLPGFAGCRAVFTNGRFSAERSSLTSLPPGVEIASLRDLLARAPQRVEGLLGGMSGAGSSFVDLNTSFVEDGAVVFLGEGVVVPEPIEIAFLSANPGRAASVSYPRVLVVAGPRSEARIVERYAGPEGQTYFSNAVTEIEVGTGASIDHYTLQREGGAAFHVHFVAARTERDARFHDATLSLGALLSRTDIEVRLDGEGGETTLDGLFVVDGRRHTDTHTLIDHARPHCSSRELYKGIVDGAGRGVFDGTIIVRKDAQKTDAAQTNKNLLLSREALVHSTPRLEIFADDVKCKHGSTTGQLDDAALFYLRSRGIAEAEARSLLVYAFASDLVGRLQVEPLRQAVTAHLRTLLPGVATVAEAVA
jgi:Fe-S cluster assembly protein SufD